MSERLFPIGLSSKVDPIIRSATLTDCDFIVTSQLQCIKETTGKDGSKDLVTKGVSMVLNTQSWDRGKYFIVENRQTNEPIGCFLIQRQWSDWNNLYYVLFESLYLQEEYRGMGVIQEIFYRFELMFLERHFTEHRQHAAFKITVLCSNTRMMHVLEKEGYRKSEYIVFEKRHVSDRACWQYKDNRD